MIGKLMAMTLVACDQHRNPAARRVAQQASRTLDSVAKFVDSLCASSGSSVQYSEQRCAVPSAPPPRPKAPQVPHCTIPDYTARIRATAEGLYRAYCDHLSAIESTKREIDSHERIDLAKLDDEIKGVRGQIAECQSSVDALGRQRQTFRAEGLVRNVFAHGFSQISLAHQMSKLRDKKNTLVSKQTELEAQVFNRKSFDFSAMRALLKSQEQKLCEIARDYNAQMARLNGFAQQMKGCVDRIAEVAPALNSEIDRFNVLCQYEAELDAAHSSYDQMLVHRKCEAAFGDGRVGRLRGQSRSRIDKLVARYNEQIRVANRRARQIGLLT